MTYSYKYPRPMVTVDIILLTNTTPERVLLIQRKNNPFRNNWALPGGFVEMEEELEEAAIRELQEETGIEIPQLHQFKTYGTVNRDPRGRTISIIYYKCIESEYKAVANDDAGDAGWYSVDNLPDLAFDHKKIIEDFLNHRNHLPL
ncbi:NUDIX domain-containing protein [Saccharicrinis sp. FJH54]|uniref:NUDIX domain-containing protein n=1 Tax=Saccharicrinis sp. FJH54 TaxID=3344665 RepID=UPI0035D4FA16